MWRSMVFVLLGTVCINASNLINFTRLRSNKMRGRPRLYGHTLGTQAELEQAKYLAYVQFDGTPVGNAIIINKYFSVSSSYHLASYADADLNSLSYMYLVSMCLSPLDSSCVLNGGSEGILRQARQVLAYNDPVDCPAYIDCLYLIRSCPKWPPEHFDYVPVPSLYPDYRNIETHVGFLTYNYMEATDEFIIGHKRIAEYCECKNVPQLELPKHVCLAEDWTIFGESLDEASSMIVTSFYEGGGVPHFGDYIGFLKMSQEVGDGAEIVIYLGHEDYQNWFATVGNPNTY